MSPIFTEEFIKEHIGDFNLSSVSDHRNKTNILKGLISELQAGKLEALNESEIASRFINQFFGDILGFNYGNSTKWHLREQKKSEIDGTKPDAALGFFSIDQENDEVRIIIEMKGASVNLDEKQKRPGGQSPEDQAFNYVAKMGGQCAWVILSNMKEIRFYPSIDRTKCQVYHLEQLTEASRLRELLFLFHKDRFIKKRSASKTDLLFERAKNQITKKTTPLHIIDKIHKCLIRFEGFGYVEPKYLANLYPFNILDDYVWHYSKGNLSTINPEIYCLLKHLSIENNQVTISDELQQEIEQHGVVEAKEKLQWCFQYLNQCSIASISGIKDYRAIEEKHKNALGFSIRHHHSFEHDIDGVQLEINVTANQATCDCLLCNYRNFEVSKLLEKLKVAQGDPEYNTLDYAYANFLLASNNFKSAYLIYRSIDQETKGKEGRAIAYFLAKKNLKNLYKPILDYNLPDKTKIQNELKTIDLDKVIYDDIEFSVDSEVKNYLIEVKEDDLIYEVQDEIDEAFDDVEKLKKVYDSGSNQVGGLNKIQDLTRSYYRLYLHVHNNRIIYENYRRYKALTERTLMALMLSHTTPKVGIPTIPLFYLAEAVLSIPEQNLREILKGVKAIKITPEDREKFLARFSNLLQSYYRLNLFSEPEVNDLILENLNSYKFRNKLTNWLTNFINILSKLEIKKEEFEVSKKHLINYMKIEEELSWPHIESFGKFLIEKGDLFTQEELFKILENAIIRNKINNNKYWNLISELPRAFLKYYPDFKITNSTLVDNALLKCRSHDGKTLNYRGVINLTNICNEECKEIMFRSFEDSLDKTFDADFYETLLIDSDYDYSRKGYFERLVKGVNLAKDGNPVLIGKFGVTNLYFLNLINIVRRKQLTSDKELTHLTNLNPFESWILRPDDFEYALFDPRWVIDVKRWHLNEVYKGNDRVREAIEVHLKKEFLAELSEILYTDFNAD